MSNNGFEWHEPNQRGAGGYVDEFGAGLCKTEIAIYEKGIMQMKGIWGDLPDRVKVGVNESTGEVAFRPANGSKGYSMSLDSQSNKDRLRISNQSLAEDLRSTLGYTDEDGVLRGQVEKRGKIAVLDLYDF